MNVRYIDLHLHLDGSLPPETILKLAERSGVRLPADSPETLCPFLSVEEHCQSLNEYLEKFDLPIAVLQTQECLELAAYELLTDLNRRGVAYTEIRFAPSSHCTRGLSQEQVIESVLSGMNRAMGELPIRAQLIACCMRGKDNVQANRETVLAAKRFLGAGVCCIDLAGAEALFPTEDFAPLFAFAQEQDMPYIIHAGEAAGCESVRAALRLGAKRIGHGVAAAADAALMDRLREERIPLEVCVTSNVQTKAVPCLEQHPIRLLMERGVPVTVNTDNMTVSNTDMAKEVSLLHSAFHFTDEEILRLQDNAVDAAFLSETEKETLRKTLRLR